MNTRKQSPTDGKKKARRMSCSTANKLPRSAENGEAAHTILPDPVRNYQMQTVLSTLLRTSLTDTPLEDQLELALEQIISIPWLALESKGGIFLVEDDPEVLVLKAQRELSEQHQEMCAKVPFGRCLCGRAALSREVALADCIDWRHENRFEGMPAHGHYCVPILSNGKVLGVINLYVREGHPSDDTEEIFLRSAADVLAGIIERKRAEQELRTAHTELELQVEERTAQLARANEGLQLEIAERKRTEAALRESEGRYRTLVETSPDAIVLTDLDAKIIMCNRRAAELLGYEKVEDLLSRNAVSFVVPEERESALENIRITTAMGHSSNVEYVLLRKNGSSFPTEVNGSLVALPDEGPRAIIVVIRDITERKRNEENLRQSIGRMRRTLSETIEAMAATVEMRDPYTAGHQRRVAELSSAIAVEMGLPEEQTVAARLAAVVHDIGKISIPAEILSKPGRLNEIEFQLIKAHPQVGHEIIRNIEFPWPIAQIVLQHHERMDGSGYPSGLVGEQILLEARIIAVADVVEAMASHRPYRAALGIDRALDEIAQKSGILYDAQVVNACLRLFTVSGFRFEQRTDSILNSAGQIASAL